MSSAFSIGRNYRPKPTSSTPFGFVVTDINVAPTHAKSVQQSLLARGWKTELFAIPAGETSKSLAMIETIFDKLIACGADRRTMIIAVGGGVVGDAAGFAAATFMRGLPFVQVPTTLLAAVDSSVGGKTGVNHPHAKNMIGAFYQPIGVLIDTATLQTLPEREYRAGLAEVVKYGMILDEQFLGFLETSVAQIDVREPKTLTHIISRSCQLKADVVQKDEFELSGLRAALNYGHTFGHAFEALAGYGQLLHGEAVSIGMIYASRLAEKRGLISSELTNRQVSLLRKLNLPTELPEGFQPMADEIIGRMRMDKKSLGGNLRFILPVRAGEVKSFSDIPESDVRSVIAGVGG
jgi:3-dehydroquinate synthase